MPGNAATTYAEAARTVAGCTRLTVTEEGISVTLSLRRISAPRYGAASTSFAATGSWDGHPMALDIQLIQAGRTVVLLTETEVGDPLDQTLVARVARIAADKAA